MGRIKRSLKAFKLVLHAVAQRTPRLTMRSRGKHILLISPDTQWRKVVQDVWVNGGIVNVESDLNRGIKSVQRSVARKQKYALIIMDVLAAPNIPAAIRDIQEKHPDARIIVATAAPVWTQARDAFNTGAVDYIIKSLNKDQLREVFKRALTITPLKAATFDKLLS